LHTIATDPHPAIGLALIVGPDGDVIAAWLTRLADDAVQLAVARDPNWQVTRWSLSEPLAKVGQLTGGWSHDALLRWAQADEVTSYQTGWEAASAGLIPLEPLPLGAVFFTQGLGQRGAYVWQAGDGIRLHEESGVERMLFSWAADMEGLVAAASGEGEPVLAWQDPEGALWVWDDEVSAKPIKVSATGTSHRLVCSRGECHLFWLQEGEICTAGSGVWNVPVLTGAHPASRDAWAPAVDALGELHLVWAADGELYHALDDDWLASRETLGSAEAVSRMDLAIGPRGDVHVLWAAPLAADAYAVRYLCWDPRLAQARIVGPEADTCVYGSTTVYLETNLPACDVARVAFYLEASPDANDAVAGSLLALESIRGDDGIWSADLDGDKHGADYRQRVVAQMRCADGSVRWAWGEWFTLAPAGAPLIWIEGGTRLVMYLPGVDAPLPDRLDVYLEPRFDGDVSTPAAIGSLPDLPRRYAGSVVPDQPGRYVLDLPVADLADGTYTVRLWVEEADGRYLLPSAPQVEVHHSGLPRVQVNAPTALASARDDLMFEALADDVDGSVAQVAFYLISSPEAASQSAVWLGTDTDGSDGWAVRARPGEAGLWYVRAEATDNDGRRNVSHSEEPIRLTSPALPTVSFVTPSDGSVVRNIKTVRLALGSGDTALDRATLMLAPPHGCYELLGPLVNEGNELRYAWDTRSLPDGTYRLGAVLEFADGHTALIETEVEVVNHPPGLRFATPRDGQRVQGWQVVRLVPSVVGEPPERTASSSPLARRGHWRRSG